jgi:hypothetical protein
MRAWENVTGSTSMPASAMNWSKRREATGSRALSMTASASRWLAADIRSVSAASITSR